MAKKQNPYQLWLGLAPELTNPNLFQILGIDPKSTDDEAIKEMAKISAKSLMKKLKAVPIKSDTEKKIKQRLQAKILLAHETICSPSKRTAYLGRIASKSNTLTTGKSAASKDGSKHSPPRHDEDSQKGRHKGPPKSSKNVVAPPVVNKRESQAIPAAIPMAIPVTLGDDSPRPGLSPSSGTDANADQATDSGFLNSAPDFRNLNSEPLVKVVTGKRTTSRSWIIPLVVLVLIVGGIGGLVSLLTRFNNVLELIPGLLEKAQNQNQSAPMTPLPGTPSPTGSLSSPSDRLSPSDDLPLTSTSEGELSSAHSPSLVVPKTPKYAIKYNGDEDPEMELPADGMPRLIGETEDSKIGTETIGVRPEDAERESHPSQGESAPTAGSQSDANPFDIDPDDGGMQLSDAQLTVVRLAHQRSRDALFRQHTDLASHFNKDAKTILKRMQAASPEDVITEQRGLVRSINSMEKIIQWVKNFWSQVKSSSIKRAGGESIVVGGKTMALVEGRDHDVVLRIAGKNNEINYRDLTPIFAITLGDLSEVPDVPRWNLAKSAFLAVMRDQYDRIRPLQNELLTQLQSDGYDDDCGIVSDYAKTTWSTLGLPAEKIAPLSESEFEKEIARVRKTFKYSDPLNVSVDRIDELIYLLTLDPQPNVKTRVASLWETVALIERGNRVFDLLYVNRELTNLSTEVDFERSLVNPMVRMSKTNLSEEHQNHLARQSLIALNRFQNHVDFSNRLKRKLIELVINIAKEFENDQLAAMADQINLAEN